MATRTLTEFAGTLIRMASKAESEARKSLPKELKAVAPAPAPEQEVTAQPHADHKKGAGEMPHAEPEVEGGPGEKSESGAFSSATEATDEEMAIEKAAEPSVMAEAKKPEMESETDDVKAVLDEAVSKATNTTGDRLARLREALRAVGGKAERVRLVRVYGVEEPVSGASRVGEHQYIVNLLPASMKQEFKDPRDDKKGQRGPKRPSGGKPKGPEGSLEGSFSMETVAQDRKSERALGGGPGRGKGGPGGAGGRPPGRPGARPPGGGRPGGRPGAKPAPKP